MPARVQLSRAAAPASPRVAPPPIRLVEASKTIGASAASKAASKASGAIKDSAAAEPAKRPPGRPQPALPRGLTVHFMRNLAVCAVEAIDGLRPIEQFATWITHEVAAELATRRQLRSERHQRYTDQRRRVPSAGAVNVSFPSAGVAEVAIVIKIERRSFAVAMRLEWVHERWRATCLTVL